MSLTQRNDPIQTTPAEGCRITLRDSRWPLAPERVFSEPRFQELRGSDLDLPRKCRIDRGSTSDTRGHMESLLGVAARSTKKWGRRRIHMQLLATPDLNHYEYKENSEEKSHRLHKITSYDGLGIVLHKGHPEL
jgi:hypothetical protein